MKCDGKWPSQFNQGSCPLHIDAAVGRQDAENDTVRAFAFRELDVKSHDLELGVGVAEIAGTWTNDRMHSDRNLGSNDREQAQARGYPSFEQVAAQFDPLSPAALRRQSGGDRV